MILILSHWAPNHGLNVEVSGTTSCQEPYRAVLSLQTLLEIYGSQHDPVNVIFVDRQAVCMIWWGLFTIINVTQSTTNLFNSALELIRSVLPGSVFSEAQSEPNGTSRS